MFTKRQKIPERDKDDEISGGACQKRLNELKKGDVFRTVLGDEQNGVTYTLLTIKKISVYPGLCLTVRRPHAQTTEIIYGRPFSPVTVVEKTSKKGKRSETISDNL